MSMHPLGTNLTGSLRFTGTATSATGTLYVNGSSVGTTVTMSGSGAVLDYSVSTSATSVGDRVQVRATATVGGVSETQYGRTEVIAAAGALTPLNPTTAGRTLDVDTSNRAPANVTAWSGTAVAAVDTAGYPKVTIKSGTGTGELSITSGLAAVNVTQLGGTAIASAVFRANVVQYGGTNIPTPYTAGVPVVTLKSGQGTGEVETDKGAVCIVPPPLR